MNIRLLTGYRPAFLPDTRFIRENELHYQYHGDRYTVFIQWAGEVRAGNSFYSIRVEDKSGHELWSGGKTIFYESIFCSDFLHEEQQRLVITRVNATDTPQHMQVVLVNLASGQEEIITEEDFYPSAGHFFADDRLYYYRGKETMVYVPATGDTFCLSERLRSFIPVYRLWFNVPVPGHVLVLTGDAAENALLLHTETGTIRERATVPLEGYPAWYGTLYRGAEVQEMIWQCHRLRHTEKQTLIYDSTAFYRFEFPDR